MNIELASLNNLIDIKELYELLFSDMAKLQPKYFHLLSRVKGMIY